MTLIVLKMSHQLQEPSRKIIHIVKKLIRTERLSCNVCCFIAFDVHFIHLRHIQLQIHKQLLISGKSARWRTRYDTINAYFKAEVWSAYSLAHV